MKRNSLILILALFVVACGGADGGAGSTDDTTTTTEPLTGPDETYPLITVTEEGGFVPVHFNLRRVPRFVLMSDGALYMQAPTTLEYPGAAVQAIQVGQVGEEALERIQGLIADAGLDEVDDESNDVAADEIADAATTVFVYTDPSGVEHRFAVYAIGMGDVDYQDPRVADLQMLVTALDEAAASMADADIWQPDSVAVYVSNEPLGFDQEFANTMDYPLDRPFEQLGSDGSDLPGDYRCETLDGADATELLETMAEANEATTFVDADGNERSIVVKPLLPGQAGC